MISVWLAEISAETEVLFDRESASKAVLRTQKFFFLFFFLLDFCLNVTHVTLRKDSPNIKYVTLSHKLLNVTHVTHVTLRKDSLNIKHLDKTR